MEEDADDSDDCVILFCHQATQTPPAPEASICQTRQEELVQLMAMQLLKTWTFRPFCQCHKCQTDAEAPIISLFLEDTELFDNQLTADVMTPAPLVTQPQANVKEVPASTTRSSPAPQTIHPLGRNTINQHNPGRHRWGGQQIGHCEGHAGRNS